MRAYTLQNALGEIYTYLSSCAEYQFHYIRIDEATALLLKKQNPHNNEGFDFTPRALLIDRKSVLSISV